MENDTVVAYEPKVKDELMGLLVAFFKEEQGNRITSNNVDGLTMKVSFLLRQNEVKPKEKEPKEKEK